MKTIEQQQAEALAELRALRKQLEHTLAATKEAASLIIKP